MVEGIQLDPGAAAEAACWQLEKYRFVSKSWSVQKSSLQQSVLSLMFTQDVYRHFPKKKLHKGAVA